MRGRDRLVRACILVAAVVAGGGLGGVAGFFAFGLAADSGLWTPQTGGFSAGYEAVGVAGLFVLVGAGAGACGALGLAVWQIRRRSRAPRS